VHCLGHTVLVNTLYCEILQTIRSPFASFRKATKAVGFLRKMSKGEMEETDYEERAVNHRKRRYLLCSFMLVIISTLVIPLCTDVNPFYFPLAGGCWGFLCSAFVMIQYLRSKGKVVGGPPMALLFWRCVADLGLAIRFIATPGFNLLICGKSECSLIASIKAQANCGFASAMFEFFEISSEAWFVSVSVDLFLTITRPFSRFEDRLKYYHIFSWGMGFLFAIPAGLINSVRGFWFITDKSVGGSKGAITDDTICWLQIEPGVGHLISWKPWVFFYVPLLLSYIFCVGVLYNSFKRLKTGVKFTFVHRIRVLFTNSINMTICLLYWTIMLSIYVITYLVANVGGGHPSQTAKTLFNILVYMIPAKGATAVVVWTLATYMDFSGSDDESIDLNAALREEVLLYASEGIRKSCKRASLLKNVSTSDLEKKKQIRLMLKQAHDEDAGDRGRQRELISGKNFLMLVLGFQGPLEKLKAAINSRNKAKLEVIKDFRQSIIRNSTAGHAIPTEVAEIRMQMAAIQENKDRGGGNGDNDDDLLDRLSQRNTISINVKNPLQVQGELSSIEEGRPSKNTQQKRGSSTARQENSETDTGCGSVSNAGRNSKSGPRSSEGPLKMSRKVSSSGISLPVLTVGTEEEEEDLLIDLESEEENRPWYFLLLDFIIRLPIVILCWCTTSGSEDDVEFTEFEPYHFGRVRESAALTDNLYRDLFLERVKERLTQGGASGAFFFFSKDECLIAKSCTEEDVDVLVANAENYADYMTASKGSYISKIYGCYMLQIYDTRLFFMVMNNIFLNDKQHKNLVKYDIKGSWVSRNASVPRNGDRVTCKFCEQKYTVNTKNKRKKHRRGPSSDSVNSASTPIKWLEAGHLAQGCSATVDRMHEALVIYKDNDLRERILLPPDVRRTLLAQLKQDATYLHSVGVMDYSLLIGVHYTKYSVSTEDAVESDEENVIPSKHEIAASFSNLDPEETNALNQLQYCVPLEVGRVVGPDCYYIGIIDFQQKWTWSKVMERWFKILMSGKDPDGLSAIETNTYFHRFCEKMEDLFHLPDDDEVGEDHRSRTLTAVDSMGSMKAKSPRTLTPASQNEPALASSILMRGTDVDDEGL